MKSIQYALLALTSLLSLKAQVVKPEYAAPAPRTCAIRNLPKAGGPTVEQVKQYVACDQEGYTENFTTREVDLIGNLNVEIAKARPFNIRTDSWPDVDPSQPIYPIRGNYTKWICYAPKPDVGPDSFPVPSAGKNCTKSFAPAVIGQCYKDSFGDWHCKLCCAGQAITETKWMVSYFPPPPANR